jgi:hypothetical protein
VLPSLDGLTLGHTRHRGNDEVYGAPKGRNRNIGRAAVPALKGRNTRAQGNALGIGRRISNPKPWKGETSLTGWVFRSSTGGSLENLVSGMLVAPRIANPVYRPYDSFGVAVRSQGVALGYDVAPLRG